MNWNSMDKDVLSHWQKLGQFRSNHISIGAGEHKMLQSSPYTFSRTYNKNNINDKVVIATEVQSKAEIDVSSVWADDTKIKDFYTGKKYTVTAGKVNIDPNKNSVILLEEVK